MTQNIYRIRKDVRLGWLPDPRGRTVAVYKPAISPGALPVSVDLTLAHNVPIVNQGQLGSCTGNAIANALSYLQEIEGESLVYPSRLFIYYNERVIEGDTGTDAGANIMDGITSVVSTGYCAETDWPYDVTAFATKPPAQAYTDAAKDLVQKYQKVMIDANAIQSALASGFPVIVGFDVYDSFMSSTSGDIPMPDLNTETIQGGHAVIVVGYDQGTQRFKFANSWGTSWGNRGYGTLPFAYLGSSTYGGDYWIVQGDQSVGPVPPPPTPPPGPTPDPNNPGCNPFGNLAGIFGSGGG